jgi:N-formylglutamate amidohydrolase
VSDPAWEIVRGDDPILATAIHAGHTLRPEAEALTALDDDERLREEDPATDRWVKAARNTIVVDRSRFEFDLNRPRDKAVYREPADAWGLNVWKSAPTDEFVAGSLELYDEFFAELGAVCDELVATHGRFVVLDLHSYNHRRRGADQAVDDPEENPEINLGTESVPAAARHLVDVFADALRAHPFDQGHLDVRENVKFKGGQMTRWINARYPDTGCSIAVELKKIYMDEWTGQVQESVTAEVRSVLTAATESVRAALLSSGSS